MTFRQLMQHLELTLGHHNFPLNPDARTLRALFDSCALHHELTVELINEIYRGNRCHGLDAEVELAPTLEAIAPVRLKTLRSHKTDIDTFRFIEDACAAIVAHFHDHLAHAPATAERPRAVVLPFPGRRARPVKSRA